MTWGPVSFHTHPGPLLHVASGLLLVALAAFVASVKPRRRANLAFAGFSGGWGLAEVASWALDAAPSARAVLTVPPTSALYVSVKVLEPLFLGVAVACLPLVAVWFPRSLSGREVTYARRAALGAGAFGVVAGGVWLPGWSGMRQAYLGQGVSGAAVDALLVSQFLIAVVMPAVAFFALFLLALRAGCAEREDQDTERRQHVLMSVALILSPTVQVGIWAVIADAFTFGHGATLLPKYAALCLLAALWLRNARPSTGPGARTARGMALLTLALPVVAWGLYSFFTRVVPLGGPPGIAGAARTLTVLILAYAIVRHQLLGIDVKLRWTISRSTVAGSFIAVFFIAGEGAQLVFGAENEWVGLAAAGALVFAIAPLQRAAERLAEKAVPASDVATSPDADREQAFRRAVRLALRDRELTREEERDLVMVATQLGLTPERAFALRDEVEREARVVTREGPA